ncbi:hypothetical protein BTJ48_01292 [Bacillus mycoides]|nr:hypothetical protein BTJ48_01292 [Bacillus mycoides]
MICLIVVLFPAPFKPIKPTSSPLLTENETFCSTGRFVYPPVTFSTRNNSLIRHHFLHLYSFTFVRNVYIHLTKNHGALHSIDAFKKKFKFLGIYFYESGHHN